MYATCFSVFIEKTTYPTLSLYKLPNSVSVPVSVCVDLAVLREYAG